MDDGLVKWIDKYDLSDIVPTLQKLSIDDLVLLEVMFDGLFSQSIGFGLNPDQMVRVQVAIRRHNNNEHPSQKGVKSINPDGTTTWCIYDNGIGTMHRINKPAVIFANGRKTWFRHGTLHCLSGPSATNLRDGKDVGTEYHVDGLLYSNDAATDGGMTDFEQARQSFIGLYPDEMQLLVKAAR